MSDLTSRFTGLFSRWGEIARRPHDPDVCCWAGVVPNWGEDGGALAVGGAAWDEAGARAAALGEAVERWQPRPLPGDELIETSFADWTRDEEAIAPGRWVLFGGEQYAQPGFPFAALTELMPCSWTCCRDAATGLAAWVPAALVFLAGNAFVPSVSTGLSAGRVGGPVLLRGSQEVIERDALVGAWWGRYALREHDAAAVWRMMPEVEERLTRPNLRWRFYRVDTPLSSHVTVVTLEGDDFEGHCFSAGSACRENRRDSWRKSLLEAVQGRHYVRYLRRTSLAQALRTTEPDSFAGHALWYSVHPDRLRQTPLWSPPTEDGDAEEEVFDAVRERVGPILFRLMTPPGLERTWTVARVLIPGTQPLHGHHRYPFLGGPLWGRPLREWDAAMPHPFP